MYVTVAAPHSCPVDQFLGNQVHDVTEPGRDFMSELPRDKICIWGVIVCPLQIRRDVYLGRLRHVKS
jgi:hypothetical protein